MRKADLVMAIVLAVFSGYLIIKSMELPVGWVKGTGPGGGTFSFWLAIGMFICAIIIIVRWVLKLSPTSQSTEPFMQQHSIKVLSYIVFSLVTMVGLIHVIGVYGSVPVFLILYLRFYGQHSWRSTTAFALGVPVVLFFLFDIAMRVTLPKGYIEPLFYPLYDIFL